MIVSSPSTNASFTGVNVRVAVAEPAAKLIVLGLPMFGVKSVPGVAVPVLENVTLFSAAVTLPERVNVKVPGFAPTSDALASVAATVIVGTLLSAMLNVATLVP